MGPQGWQSRGWWNLNAGECTVVVGGDLQNRYYYYYAHTSDGREWNGPHTFCVLDQAFTIGQACPPSNEKGFGQIDTGESDSFTQGFTCDDCTDPAAVQAIRRYLPQLEALANQNLPQDYQSDWIDVGPVDVRFNIARQPLRLSLNQTQLTVAARISYAAEAGPDLPLVGRRIVASCGVGEPRRLVDASIIMTFGIDNNRRVTGIARVENLSFPNRCLLTAADIDVTDDIENYVRPKLEQVVAALNERVRNLSITVP
jgi:hypothetical protein